jgi:hypothetical protein
VLLNVKGSVQTSKRFFRSIFEKCPTRQSFGIGVG